MVSRQEEDGGAVAGWVRALDWRPSAGDRVVLGLNPAAATSLRNFGNSIYPALSVSFGGDTKIHLSLLSGAYAREVKVPTSLHWKCETCRGPTTLRPCSHHRFGTGTVPEPFQSPVFRPVPLRPVVPERADHLAI